MSFLEWCLIIVASVGFLTMVVTCLIFTKLIGKTRANQAKKKAFYFKLRMFYSILGLGIMVFGMLSLMYVHSR